MVLPEEGECRPASEVNPKPPPTDRQPGPAGSANDSTDRVFLPQQDQGCLTRGSVRSGTVIPRIGCRRFFRGFPPPASGMAPHRDDRITLIGRAPILSTDRCTMPIKFECPGCHKKLTVADAMAGKRGKCPACQKQINVPANGATPPPASPASKPAAASKPGGPSAPPAPATKATRQASRPAPQPRPGSSPAPASPKPAAANGSAAPPKPTRPAPAKTSVVTATKDKPAPASPPPVSAKADAAPRASRGCRGCSRGRLCGRPGR